jgi:hypothetical protein
MESWRVEVLMGLRLTQEDEKGPDESWVGGPGLAFETWVFRLGPICEEKPKSQERDLGHPLKVWKGQLYSRPMSARFP